MILMRCCVLLNSERIRYCSDLLYFALLSQKICVKWHQQCPRSQRRRPCRQRRNAADIRTLTIVRHAAIILQVLSGHQQVEVAREFNVSRVQAPDTATGEPDLPPSAVSSSVDGY
ncbi:hypothetical protein MRX96_033719 [Rhipicephalus microplus]